MFTDLVCAAVLYGTPASARRIPWITGLLMMVGSVVPYVAWRTPRALLIGAAMALVTLVPAATGWVVRNHRDTAVAERLRAEQTALLAEMDRTQAVTAERARMARELHDMVANHLSAIAIHSTAALSLDDPKTSRDALAVIRENSVGGLAEMRRLIGILRDSGNEREIPLRPPSTGSPHWSRAPAPTASTSPSTPPTRRCRRRSNSPRTASSRSPSPTRSSTPAPAASPSRSPSGTAPSTSA